MGQLVIEKISVEYAVIHALAFKPVNFLELSGSVYSDDKPIALPKHRMKRLNKISIIGIAEKLADHTR